MPRTISKQVIDVAIIGAGTLATALAVALKGRGYGVLELVARDNSQSVSRARKLAKVISAREVPLRGVRQSNWSPLVIPMLGAVVTLKEPRALEEHYPTCESSPAFILV